MHRFKSEAVLLAAILTIMTGCAKEISRKHGVITSVGECAQSWCGYTYEAGGSTFMSTQHAPPVPQVGMPVTQVCRDNGYCSSRLGVRR